MLNQARSGLAGNDLGRVVIHHEGLPDPNIVPLQPWDQLNVDKVVPTIEKELNSNENLPVNDSLQITIELIDLPKGSGGPRRKFIRKIREFLKLNEINCYN